MNAEPSFGQWLKKRRRALDLTQEELAQRVPCAVITVQKIEANERRPSKQMAERLAEHLDVAAEDLPAFVTFARMKPGAQWPATAWRVAHLAPWSPWRRHLTNLPVQPTRLIGRDRDVAAVRQRLLGDGTRLLTLLGPPGVGKTRLAVQVGAVVLDDFGDGLYWVELAPVRDPNQVAATIAHTLGVHTTASRSFAERIKEYLRDKHMLLVLDNFEHVLAAAPFISQLLTECPSLSILATSRAPLHVRHERRFPVPPLAVPAGLPEDADLTEWMRYSAIALFVERAQSVRPDFALTSQNARAIAAICGHVDGLPLAIELASARIGVLPPQALLEQLSSSGLVLQAKEPRDIPERHHTLHSAIEWSCALLAQQEQAFLAWLGVFTAGCTLEAAENVILAGGQPPPSTALDLLTTLVDSNLVVEQDVGGKPRFALLETIRAYALDRLAESGEEEMVRQRHAEYYLALAEEADQHLRTAQQQVWLDRLEAEGGNLRAALDWFIERSADTEAGLRLVAALAWFWTVRSHTSEGRHWSSRALHRGKHVRPDLHAKVLFRAGMLYWPDDLAASHSLVEQGILLLRDLGPAQEWELAFALSGLALIRAYEGDCDAVQSAAEESVALFQRIGDKWGVALALAVLGEAYLLRHDYSGACSRFEESLALFREIGDRWGIGIPLLNWGYTDSLQGNLEAARARLEESIAMHRAVGECSMRSLGLNILAQVVQQKGNYEQAVALYAETLDLLRKMGIEAAAADVLHNLAYLAQRQGHFSLAAGLYSEALALFSKQGNEAGIAKCQAGLAAVASN